ncbi:hypothetical protein DKK66_11400 [Aquitalea sp. USM4]|nr:hypothetical protein DKK66_11400 [Aquitalea sp. USM4]
MLIEIHIQHATYFVFTASLAVAPPAAGGVTGHHAKGDSIGTLQGFRFLLHRHLKALGKSGGVDVDIGVSIHHATVSNNARFIRKIRCGWLALQHGQRFHSMSRGYG